MSFMPNTIRMSLLVAVSITLPLAAQAQQRSESITEPVYRVARETPAKPVSATSAPVATASAEEAFFDLTQKPGEHPLAPALRLAERVQKHIEQDVKDYSCSFAKIERIDGELSETNLMDMRVLHDPFAVHFVFRQPKAGQECLYVEGSNDDKLLARGHGWRARFGVLHLDPTGDRAMDGQRYPITMAGVKKLTDKMIEIATADLKYGECEVKKYMNVKLDKRPTVMVEITHPVPRKEFRFHLARLYVDKELKLPVRYEAYDWKKDKNGKPELTELYMYRNLKVNNGFTAANFAESDPMVFK